MQKCIVYTLDAFRVSGYVLQDAWHEERNLPRMAGDWEVEQLTPKLREYIAARFREA